MAEGVSVILPTTRIDHWLSQAVSSVLSSKGVNFELIVIHDGVDPDENQEWFHDPRVQILHNKESLGLAGALNKAISESKFQFIGRLDADDLMDPDRLNFQFRYLAQNEDVCLVSTNVMRIDESGIEIGPLQRKASSDMRKELLYRNTIAHSSVMFRKSVYLKAGGYNSTLRQMEDYDLWLRMSRLGKIARISEILTFYRIHNNQMSRKAKSNANYIQVVCKSRNQLSIDLKQPSIQQSILNLTWKARQRLRTLGVIRPGYLGRVNQK